MVKTKREGTLVLPSTEVKVAMISIVTVGVLIFLIQSHLDSEKSLIQEILKEKIPDCGEFQFYSEYYEQCMRNKITVYRYMHGEFERKDTKQIVGRIVQIESGDHITLESGEKFAISNSIENLWIDDLVRLHQISFLSGDNCKMQKIHFRNTTERYSENYNFDPKWNYNQWDIIPQKELIETASKYFVEYYDFVLNEESSFNLSEFPDTKDSCSKKPIWEIEKLE